MSRLHAVTLVAFLSMFVALQSYASENVETTWDKSSPEVIDFVNSCKSDNAVLNKYYDCSCLSEKYVEKREELGEEVNSSVIQLEIGVYCHRSSILVREAVSDCEYMKKKSKGMLPPGVKSCACFGESIGGYWMDSSGETRFSTGWLIGAKSLAARACR